MQLRVPLTDDFYISKIFTTKHKASTLGTQSNQDHQSCQGSSIFMDTHVNIHILKVNFFDISYFYLEAK